MRNKTIDAALRSILFAGLTFGVAVSNAQNQTADSQTNQEELETVVVTGSYIPINLSTPGVPVTVITAEDIAATGVATDLLDVLTKSNPFFFGANNIGSDNGNISSGSTNGGSSVALRNRATLVLINGRRAAVNPVVASGGSNFVDVSLIPIGAVERIEILSDGASATYGSDAVGGVVNVIMKTNYEGVEVGARYGMSNNDGDYSELSYYGVAGASFGDTSVTISTEYKHSDPLIQKDRPFARGLFRSPTYAGVVNIGNDWYYLNPSLNAPPRNVDLTPAQLVAQGVYQGPLTQTGASQFFDLANAPTMLIEAERRSFTAAVSHELNSATTLFADFLYTSNNTVSVLNAQPVSGNVLGTNANNPFASTVTARNRFTQFPRIYDTTNNATRAVLGVRGDLTGSWKYEAAANFNRTVSNYQNKNLIDAAAYTAAVNAGTFNPFARQQAPGLVEGMLGTQYRDYESTLNGYDVRVFGDVFDLPAGAVAVALGADTREEKLDFVNDRNDQVGGWLQATPRLPYGAKQETQGYFAEVRIPVFSPSYSVPGFHSLDISLAGRQEVYDSVDKDPFVPKFSFLWQPIDEQFAVRGSYSKSFTAPTLYDLTGPLSQGFTSGINIFAYTPQGVNTNVQTGSRQYRSQSGSNPNLESSTSVNWSVGFEWVPNGALDGLSVGFDWYDIEEENLISSISSSLIVSSVEQFGAASPYASLVRFGTSAAGEVYFGTGTPVTAPGQMSSRPSDTVWISNSIVNVAGFWQSGADLRIAYSRDLDGMGTLSGQITTSYINDYFIQSLPTTTPFDYAGTFSGTSVFPEWRSFAQLNWRYNGFNAGINATFIPSVTDVATPGEPKVKSYQAFDLRFGYNFEEGIAEGTTIDVGVNNVTNEFPPFIASEGNQSADINTYDPIGRFYYASIRYKF
jgi:iron complex outermembrane receptor protein